MKFRKTRNKGNTIEAFACDCHTTCYGCSTCNPSSCPCDTTYWSNPTSNTTFSTTSDNTTEVSDSSSTSISFTRYK